MKYRVILEVIFNDETNDKVGIYTYETRDLALQGHYKYMSQYIAESNVESLNVICKDSSGVIYKNEHWPMTSFSSGDDLH